MRITSLSIETAPSYATNAGQLKGTVTLEGPTGGQTVVLSSKALSQIFSVVGNEVIRQAQLNAQQSKGAVEEAINGPLLADMSEVG